MTVITSLLAGGWHWVAALAALVAALVASYFGGKKIGTVQTQAKADVASAQAETKEVAAVAKQQAENTEKANSVKQTNAALDDAAARSKLRNSRFNSDD
ncbi:MAG: hypothetical protein E6Z83_08045 [Pantoea sp.]|jgi:uncharacterized protein YlxW (UPF0749 family)|uniref:hypothetical protein n=1 Tax=Pantoea sp. TaxID=69393 RepID=UPI00290FF917|nr:hypothetical protein [Pantoea sp.]MDU5780747.1 hypothetical protein [Pantoea sp.]